MATSKQTTADQATPRPNDHSGGASLRWLSTFGVAAMTLVSIEGLAAALCWSLQGLLGFPNWLTLGAFCILSVVAIWASVWAALRNWHVERRLERGLEVDPPEWSLAAQLKSSAD